MSSVSLPATNQRGRPRRAWRNRLFTLAMLFCMFVAFGTLVVLLIDTFVTGWPAISSQLLTGLPSTVPGEAGARPAETVMIGDTVYDIEMARAAGTRAVGVAWGYHEPAELLAALGFPGPAHVMARVPRQKRPDASRPRPASPTTASGREVAG